MSITKIAKTKMEITADYQKLSDLNVAFYNQDINTSILQFDVTRNNVPVPLGKVNVEGYIVLLAKDGSRIQDAVEITNELNGVIEYTIPKEFLKHTGKALGQIYIAVKGKDDTAVMRQFSFDIEKDLLTGFSAAVKLEYIKTFDDLTTFIKQRVDEIDKAIANGEDYVSAMEKAAEKGQKDIQAVATKATTDINEVSADASKKITDTSNTAVATVNAKGDAVLKVIADNDVIQKKDALFYTDGKGFSRSVPAGITDWYQITTAGNYSITKTAVPTNAPPIGVYFNLIVNTRTSTTRDLTAINVFTGAIYTNAMTGIDAWSGWSKVATEKEAQMRKITSDNGAPLYDLNATNDLFAEASAWGNGFFTFYLSAGAANNPTGSTSWIRGTVSTYGKNSNILAYDKNGTMYVVVCANGTWGAWGKAQIYKTTEDDGSSLTYANYDLLNTTDISNFDGYVTTAVNAPTNSNSGYFKRKYRAGYIEITFSPHSSKDVYRNSYNGGSKVWVGWEKLVTVSDLSAIQPVTLWEGSANGASSAVYTLSRAVNLNRKIRVTYDFVGGSGMTATFDLKANRIASFNNFNISDATAMEPALYEWQLDFTSLTGFAIKLDNLHNLVNGTGSINRKAYTATKIEEVD